MTGTCRQFSPSSISAPALEGVSFEKFLQFAFDLLTFMLMTSWWAS